MLLVNQQDKLSRIVLHQYQNGKDKMVVWCKPGSQEIVKEETFYDNGSPDYVGYYKSDLEHGNWKFYWKNGVLKSECTYANGLEEGVSKEYDESGKLVKEVVYLHGQIQQGSH